LNSLSVIANQRKMGTVELRRDRLTFRYARSWQEQSGSYPLSASMPMVKDEHPHARIEPYLWNLLPDNRAVLERWGQQFHVSHNNVFRLLQHVGEDCAGAIQFIPEEREDELLRQEYQEQVEWIDEEDLTQRIKILLANHGAQRTGSDEGQFSLAGAQPKTALYQSPKTGKRITDVRLIVDIDLHKFLMRNGLAISRDHIMLAWKCSCGRFLKQTLLTAPVLVPQLGDERRSFSPREPSHPE